MKLLSIILMVCGIAAITAAYTLHYSGEITNNRIWSDVMFYPGAALLVMGTLGATMYVLFPDTAEDVILYSLCLVGVSLIVFVTAALLTDSPVLTLLITGPTMIAAGARARDTWDARHKQPKDETRKVAPHE